MQSLINQVFLFQSCFHNLFRTKYFLSLKTGSFMKSAGSGNDHAINTKKEQDGALPL